MFVVLQPIHLKAPLLWVWSLIYTCWTSRWVLSCPRSTCVAMAAHDGCRDPSQPEARPDAMYPGEPSVCDYAYVSAVHEFECLPFESSPTWGLFEGNPREIRNTIASLPIHGVQMFHFRKGYEINEDLRKTMNIKLMFHGTTMKGYADILDQAVKYNRPQAHYIRLYMRNTYEPGLACGLYLTPVLETALERYGVSCQGLRVALIFVVSDLDLDKGGDVVRKRGKGDTNVQRVILNENGESRVRPYGVVFQNFSRKGVMTLHSPSHLARLFDGKDSEPGNVALQQFYRQDTKRTLTTMAPLGEQGGAVHVGNVAHLAQEDLLDSLKLTIVVVVGPIHTLGGKRCSSLFSTNLHRICLRRKGEGTLCVTTFPSTQRTKRMTLSFSR